MDEQRDRERPADRREPEEPESRLQMLIGLLYGELSEEEEREIRRRMLTDAQLRAEWEELSGTRSLLHRWEINEPSPRVVFVQRVEPVARNARPASRDRDDGGPGLWARLRPFFASPAWGIAAAALCVAALGLARFGIERSAGGGWSFRLGGPRPASEAGPAGPAADSRAAEYVTRQDLDLYTRSMGQAVLTVMDGYTRQRDDAVAQVLQTALSGMSGKQAEDYRELRQRIELLGTGLLQDQARTRARLDYLWDAQNKPERIGAAPAGNPEGEGNEQQH
jgi:hypothetical protein